METYRDHGKPAEESEEDWKRSRKVMQLLAEEGIDLAAMVTRKLRGRPGWSLSLRTTRSCLPAAEGTKEDTPRRRLCNVRHQHCLRRRSHAS